MKKFAAFLLAFLMVLGCAGCADDKNDTPDPTDTPAPTTTTAPTAAPTENPADPTKAPVEGVKVMSYADYVAAAVDDEVVIEAYVQAKQSWWRNEKTGTEQATFYLQNEEGAYFVYDMPCSQADYDKLTIGTKIRVTGYKAEWSGEVEIVDATFEILDGNYIATATDVTGLLANEAELVKKQNMFVSFKGMTVESAAIYKWDGSGQDGDDLYFNVSKDGNTYSFTVESYLCDKSTEVYQAVKNLKVGDVVDMEGFLYWYEGVNPHITSVTVVQAAEAGNQGSQTPGVMSYAEYQAAAIDNEVVIEAYIQAKQSWWRNNQTGTEQATFYLQNEEGAYFVYDMPCSQADYEKLTIGTKIRVTGYKAEWSGEVEIVDATFEILDGNYIATATDVTDLLANEAELVKKQNMFVSFKGMTVESAAIYKWDGSGQDGDDLYFNVSVNGATYTFTVESYLCNNTTEVYQAVKNLKVGDVVDLEGFLYWYEGVNPHITAVAPAGEIIVNDTKSEGVMTYAEYVAAAIDDEVVIEAYVQAKQSWWQDKATVYLQDREGAYFCYNMACSEADYAKLTPGTKIKVTGYKADFSGEIEIADGTFEILEGNYVAEPTDVTALLGTDALIEKQNMFVAFKGMKVESAAIYKWDGSGQDGDDLYFNVSVNGATYTFTVESYLCDGSTDVYKAVKNLKVGDVVDMEGFLYWYEGVNPHITSVTVK